jgi:hypothetical protein
MNCVRQEKDVSWATAKGMAFSQDRQASVGDCGALADLDTKWEKVAKLDRGG